jgi:Transposase DDE domain
MRHIVNPQQTRLFDPFGSVLTEKTRERLLDGWHGVFRHVILELMPVDAIGGHFDSTMGRPTKELYSIAGLLLIKEFRNWTKEEALDAYSLHMDIQYALNLEPVAHDLGMRTLERYIELSKEDGIAKATMDEITVKLVDLLDTKIDRQRLDSTHIFSDMANFGRTRLMGVAIKRFLTQVIRSDKDDYNSLEESLRNRYAPGVNQLFADTKKDSESRRLLRRQVAEDMHFIIRHFCGNEKHNGKDTYKAVERIFYEQCKVSEEEVIINKKTGGNVMQNPSDPDATYDGHKGPGYQVQLSETCNADNDVQLITSAIAQTAVESDANAVEEVLEDLKSNGLVPDEMFADTGYTGDENVQFADEQGVELIGPVPGGSTEDDDEQLTIDDFNIDEETEEVVCCPAGHEPESSEHNNETGKTKTVMSKSHCGECEFRRQCPVKKTRDGYQLDHSAKDRRIAARRKEQATEVFRDRYKIRGGIEGTNSGLKRKTGLGQLRVRGKPAVFQAVYFRIAGWNIMRASVCAKMREIVWERAVKAVFSLNFAFSRTTIVAKSMSVAVSRQFLSHRRELEKYPKLRIAA